MNEPAISTDYEIRFRRLAWEAWNSDNGQLLDAEALWILTGHGNYVRYERIAAALKAAFEAGYAHKDMP